MSAAGASSRIRALQAAMLRLTVDPAFLRRVYGEAGAQTEVIELTDGPYTLTPGDLELLRAVDPRAWTTDRFRRARLTQALIEEYLLTAALVGVAELDAFFGSQSFARVLAQRGSMAEAVGDWLAPRVEPAVRPFVELEAAVARARRGVRAPGAGLVAAPGKEGLSLPEGTLAHWQRGLGELGAEGLRAVAEGRRWTAPTPSRSREHLLIERKEDGGLGVHPLSGGLVGVLAFCGRPRSRSAVGREARRLRVPKKRVGGLIRQMLHEGLLLER